MEKLSSLHERTKENMGNAKQSTAWAKNQNVLNNLGESSDGKLTYKGEVVSEGKTQTIFGVTTDWFLPSSNVANAVSLYFLSDMFENKKIKNFYLTINGYRVELRNLPAYNERPYIINMDTITRSNYNNLLHVVTLYCPEGDVEIIDALMNTEPFEFELEIYD